MVRTPRLRNLVYLALLVAGGFPEALPACPYCFGAAVDSTATHSMSMAILGLILITGTVFAGIIAFVLQMRKRIRLLKEGKLPVPGPWRPNAPGDSPRRLSVNGHARQSSRAL